MSMTRDVTTSRSPFAIALALAAALGACAGCGTTHATGEATTAQDDAKKAKAAEEPEESVDAALAREGERWMVEQSRRRSVAQPAANAVTRPAALPVERR